MHHFHLQIYLDGEQIPQDTQALLLVRDMVPNNCFDQDRCASPEHLLERHQLHLRLLPYGLYVDLLAQPYTPDTQLRYTQTIEVCSHELQSLVRLPTFPCLLKLGLCSIPRRSGLIG